MVHTMKSKRQEWNSLDKRHRKRDNHCSGCPMTDVSVKNLDTDIIPNLTHGVNDAPMGKGSKIKEFWRFERPCNRY